MATNTTVKKTAPEAEESTAAVTEAPGPRPKRTPAPAPTVVGPAPVAGVAAVPVRLSHHLTIGGIDYRPGSEIHVSPDYARRLRAQGYVART